MRRQLTQLFVLFALGCSASTRSVATNTERARSPANALVGTWESATLAYELMGTTLIFAPDGTFATVIGVMLNGTYRTSGNSITIILPGQGQAHAESGVLQFSNGAVDMRFKNKSRHLVPLTRTAANSLVGQWLGTQDDGVISYEEYTSDGRMRLRFPSRVGRGQYRLTGDTTLNVRMTSPPSAEHPGGFRIHGDTLRTGPSANDIYLRARPLIPANVQQPKVPIR